MVTDHGEPVAQIIPRREERWVLAAELNALLGDLGSGAAWQEEVSADRRMATLLDSWGEQA